MLFDGNPGGKILSGLPSASLGALLTLWLFDTELTIIAMIGIILLIGIVKKRATRTCHRVRTGRW